MNKNQIKKQIDDSVRIFREILEQTYLEKNKPFHGINYRSLTTFFSGKVNQRRKNNGNLWMSGELPSFMFKKEVKGLPRTLNDWNLYPLVITLFNVDEKELKK